MDLLDKNMLASYPMLEEISKQDSIVVSVIGITPGVGDNVKVIFATLDESHDKLVYRLCKAHVEQNKDKYDK